MKTFTNSFTTPFRVSGVVEGGIIETTGDTVGGLGRVSGR